MSSLNSDEGLTKSPSLRHGTAAANWLQPERFEDPNFSAEACIADFRRYVSLVRPSTSASGARRSTTWSLTPAPTCLQVPLATIKGELQTCIGNVKNKVRDMHANFSLEGRG